MPIIAKAGGGKSRIPTHPEGQFAAVCLDVADLGIQDITWQGVTRKKHRILIRFFCDEYFTDNEGKQRPLWVDKYFSLTLHEQGSLRPFLESWRGKKFTDDELEAFDVEKLLHAPALIQVSHNQVGDKTYANIDACIRLPKGMTPPVLPDYIRMEDREPKRHDAEDADDSDLPF